MDGIKQVEVPHTPSFLQSWSDVLEAPIPSEGLDGDHVRAVIGDVSPFHPVKTQELKLAMPELNTAPGPDGLTAKDLHAVPVPVLKVVLTLLMLLGRLPVCLRGAKTIFIPKKDEARDPGDFRSITVAPVLVRLFHKVLAARLQGADR